MTYISNLSRAQRNEDGRSKGMSSDSQGSVGFLYVFYSLSQWRNVVVRREMVWIGLGFHILTSMCDERHSIPQ